MMQPITPPLQKRLHGFSLVELLIAMTLGLFLIGGMIAVFAGNKRSSELNTAMANIQENARFALNAMSRDARMSAFQGCLDVNSGALEYPANTGPTTNLRDTATTGSVVDTATSWNPAPPGGFVPPTATPAIPGTHVLSLQFAGSRRGRLDAQMTDGVIPNPAGNIVLDGALTDPQLSVNDLAVISNCDFGDLFRVSSVGNVSGNIVVGHAASHNASGALTRAYGAPANIGQTMVAKFHSNIYFVADTGLTNDDGDAITALYQQSLPYDSVNNPPTQLVIGVENMRISFGIRDATGTLSYVTPDSAAFVPGNVESIRIGLLMVSWDRMASSDDTTTYILAGQPIPSSTTSTDGTTHAADERFRLAFNATIKVRNRRNNS